MEELKDVEDEDEEPPLSKVKCLFCDKVFATFGGRGGHMDAKHKDELKIRHSLLNEKKLKKRFRLDWKTKRDILQVCLNNPGISHAEIGKLNNCSSSQISKWMQICMDPQYWATASSAKIVQKIENTGVFKEAEVELYDRFLYRRKHYGLYVDGIWLRKEIKSILAIYKPVGWLTFKASNGWLHRFCIRWNISCQAKTDGKSESPEERKVKIMAVIGEYLKIQSTGEATDALFGRFAADQHWHVDSIPVSFSHPRKRSLNPVGTPCRINAMVSSSWSKRQGTIHLTIRAFGEQVVPPVLIVTGRGMRGTPEEMAHWLGLKHVLVYFQPKAWCDRHFQAWYLVNVFNKYIKESGDLREQLLCLDNLSAHKTPEVLELMTELSITPHWLPTYCTDVAAPVDHHVGALLKLFIRRKYEISLEDPDNFLLWREQDELESAHLSRSKRRMLMASWLDMAWDDMRVKSDFFLSAFTSTGCLIATNGANLIKMRGIPGMEGV